MKHDAAQKYSQRLDDQSICTVQRQRKQPWPSFCLANDSIFHPYIGWKSLAETGNTETIVHCNVVGEGKKRAGSEMLLKAMHRFTEHQAEKIYTPSEDGDSYTFKPRQTHTRVYGHFFSCRPQAFRQWLWIGP